MAPTSAPRNMEDVYSRETYQATLGECVGTCALVVLVGGASAGVVAPVASLTFALANGFAMASLVFATGLVSGGHLNPAVTFAHFLLRRVSLFKLGCYFAGQLVGGGIGALLLRAIVPSSLWSLALVVPKISSLGDNGCTLTQALAWELICSFGIVFVFLHVMNDVKRVGKYGPISVGLVVSASSLAASSFSGASFNPAARSLNLILALGSWDTNFWIFWAGPFGGALAAAFVTHWLKPADASLFDLSHMHDYGDTLTMVVYYVPLTFECLQYDGPNLSYDD